MITTTTTTTTTTKLGEENGYFNLIYLSIIVPGTPRSQSRKLKSIYTQPGGCNWDYGICITTVTEER